MAPLKFVVALSLGCLAFLALPLPGQTVITCSSNNGRRNYCSADTRGGVKLGRQISGSPCRRGDTWGFEPGRIWVDRGCRADFVIQRYRPGGPGYGPGPGGPARIVTCSSDNGRRNYCSADTRRGVYLVKQRSGSPCKQGYSWGFDGRGIWVDRGCRADFQVR